MKTLFFDTCAVIKYFIPEKGSAVVRWLCAGPTMLEFKLWRTSSPRVQQELHKVIDRKCKCAEISEWRAKQIKTTSSAMFIQRFHIRGGSSPSLPGNDVTVHELMIRHNLKPGKQDWDMEHLEVLHNHLRFLGGSSKVIVVTSDEGFKKILALEGYDVIDPETETIEKLRKMLA